MKIKEIKIDTLREVDYEYFKPKKYMHDKTLNYDSGFKYIIHVYEDKVSATPIINGLVCEPVMVDLDQPSILRNIVCERKEYKHSPSQSAIADNFKNVEPWSILVIAHNIYLYVGGDDYSVIPLDNEEYCCKSRWKTPIALSFRNTWRISLAEVIDDIYGSETIRILSPEELGDPVPFKNEYLKLTVYDELHELIGTDIKISDSISLVYIGTGEDYLHGGLSIRDITAYDNIFQVYRCGMPIKGAYKILRPDEPWYQQLENNVTRRCHIETESAAAFHLTNLDGKPAVITVVNGELYAMYHNTVEFVKVMDADSDEGIPYIADYDLDKLS